MALCIIISVAAVVFASTSAQHEDSLAAAYSNALSRLSVPKLEERKQLVRSFQRKGYTSTLLEILYRDGIEAMISHARTRLQLEFSLSHEPIMVDITFREGNRRSSDSIYFSPRKDFKIVLPTVAARREEIGLDIDWTFPEDPWKEAQ